MDIGMIFITNEVVSFQDFYENFYFLNSLFIKSLFVENLVPLVFPIYLLSVVIAFFQKDKLTNYSLLGVASIVLLSIIGFYPLVEVEQIFYSFHIYYF
ncbi:hypothetical protein CM15mP35_07970 [bacterium]|nr:MAG: hypothetical protein CM15mP35_07970 [bacterium]